MAAILLGQKGYRVSIFERWPHIYALPRVVHGVNSFLVKMTAFIVSAFFIGLAGALIALQNASIEPNSAFSLDWTVNMIIMAVLGGLATTTGPLIGVVVISRFNNSYRVMAAGVRS